MSLVEALSNPSRPVFLFGSTPPRDETSLEKARETCAKFAARSAVLATDGFIVYDIQDEGSRESSERPFPFRKTMDPSLYASFFPAVSGKECVVYKCVVSDTKTSFEEWLNTAVNQYGHRTFNLVGAASSSQLKNSEVLNITEAGHLTANRGDCKFGCVTIPERHTIKGNEHLNLMRKVAFGAQWFITQGIFATEPLIRLLADYSNLCREQGITPKKIILTFAPCGRPKTMTFIKWLGMNVPTEIETRIFSAANPVNESINVACEMLKEILEKTKGFGVPIGINVESLSIFKEEIDAAHELFQKLQAILLNSYGSPWSVRWFFVDDPIVKIMSSSHPSQVNLLLDNSTSEKEERSRHVESTLEI